MVPFVRLALLLRRDFETSSCLRSEKVSTKGRPLTKTVQKTQTLKKRKGQRVLSEVTTKNKLVSGHVLKINKFGFHRKFVGFAILCNGKAPLCLLVMMI